MPIRASIAGALLASLLYTLSFPPFGLAGLAWVALIPLLWGLRRVGALAGAGVGLLFGSASAVGLAWWLPRMLDDFFALGVLGAAAAAAGIFLAAALPYAAFGAAVAWARGHAGPVAVAGAWGLCEIARLHGPFENPWGLLGLTQASVLPIVQSAEIVGVVGLGMGIAAANAVLAAALLREPGALRAASAVACVVAAAWIYGEQRLDTPPGDERTVRVAVVQGGLERAKRIDPARAAENLDHYRALTERARRSDPVLIAWPELALQVPLVRRPDLWERLAETSRAGASDLLVGGPHERTRLYVREPLNSAFVVRDGRLVDRHDKVGLLHFAEARPPGLPLGRDLYRPGLALRPLDTRAGRLGVLLCSEVLRPELAARLAAGGATLLANPSNDDWAATPGAADHQVAVAVLRAIETRRPILRPSTNGRSAIIDAHGRLLALAPYGEATVLHAEVHPSEVATLQARWGGFGTRSAAVLLSITPWLLARSGSWRDPRGLRNNFARKTP